MQQTILEKQGKMLIDDRAVMKGKSPFYRDIHRCHKMNIPKRFGVRAQSLGFRSFAQLTMQSFNSVGSVDKPADLLGGRRRTSPEQSNLSEMT
jgi:hypothetical protein